MTKIILVPEINYIAAFLTLRCNLNCSYCINRQSDYVVPKEMSADNWIKGLGRIQTRNDLPISLQGGEPTLHPGFYEIVKGLKGKDLDLLSNGLFNIDSFTREITPDVFKRQAPYASIRFSYHANTNPAVLVSKVKGLMLKNYSVGIWALQHPEMKRKNMAVKNLCRSVGIDYREKEYLDKTHGTYKYPEGINGEKKKAFCKTTELLIGPTGHIFKCHADLYANRNPIGHILAENSPDFAYRSCDNFGACNPCDIKLKTNRLQEYGHTSVEIKKC